MYTCDPDAINNAYHKTVKKKLAAAYPGYDVSTENKNGKPEDT
jgi:hypothetical protein